MTFGRKTWRPAGELGKEIPYFTLLLVSALLLVPPVAWPQRTREPEMNVHVVQPFWAQSRVEKGRE